MKAFVVVLGSVFAVLLVPLVGSTSLLATSPAGTGLQASAASLQALADIPGELLDVYREAAATCPGLSWTVLAAIGKIETDHGRSTLPGVRSGQNAAGAMGPMQFVASTWAAFHLPGMDDVYDPRSAVFGAAHYLCASGAGVAGKLRDAIFAYNHAGWYVDQVLVQATRYAADGTHTVQAVVAGVVRSGDPFGGACRPVMTQGFGPSALPGEPAVFGFAHFHTGVDLACPAGAPVHAVSDGVAHVTTGCPAGIFACGGGWGNNVVVETQLALPGDPGDQRYYLRYAHLAVVTVADGAIVHAGALLGLEGSTGYSTGAHLHFEVDRGAPLVAHAVNPSPLLAVGR